MSFWPFSWEGPSKGDICFCVDICTCPWLLACLMWNWKRYNVYRSSILWHPVELGWQRTTSWDFFLENADCPFCTWIPFVCSVCDAGFLFLKGALEERKQRSRTSWNALWKWLCLRKGQIRFLPLRTKLLLPAFISHKVFCLASPAYSFEAFELFYCYIVIVKLFSAFDLNTLKARQLNQSKHIY